MFDVRRPDYYIDHPAAEGVPVGLVRWIKWHLSQCLLDWGNAWERDALYPERCKLCGHPVTPGREADCDHLPF